MSGHDFFITSHTLDELSRRIEILRSPISDRDVTEQYGLSDHQNWRLSEARQRLKQDKEWESKFRQLLYRPFDYRFTFYSRYLFARSLLDYLYHMLYDNRGLSIGRAGQVIGQVTWDLVFCSNSIVDLNLFYRGGNVVLPLYIYPSKGEMELQKGRQPNLSPEFIKAVSDKLGLKFVSDGRGDLVNTFGPEDIFDYAYAVFHSLTYRSRYAEFLRIDFPHLPLTWDKELFKALADKGAELVALHLMESPVLEQQRTQIKFDVSGSNTVEKVSYNQTGGRVCINKEQYFEGVPLEVWNFHIGGYQVCQKWLKDRKGRILTYDERVQYQKIVVALKETVRLTEEIDHVIPSWPIE